MKKFTERVLKNPRKLYRLTGLTLAQFFKLEQELKIVWERVVLERKNNHSRKRNPGGGRLYDFDMNDMLLVNLIYYRHYIVQELVAEFFATDQSMISRVIARLRPLIEMAADPILKDYFEQWKKENVDKKRMSQEEFKLAYPELWRIATDATDTEINRPSDYEKQKKYYSGKRKTHSIKTQITVSIHSGRFLHVSDSYPGSVHDKAVFDQDGILQYAPEQSGHYLDLGYQGVAAENPHHYLILPPKKRPKQELSLLDKENRKSAAKIRVKSEHGIRKIKTYRICSSVYRGKLPDFNATFRNVAALVNFKLTNPTIA